MIIKIAGELLDVSMIRKMKKQEKKLDWDGFPNKNNYYLHFDSNAERDIAFNLIEKTLTCILAKQDIAVISNSDILVTSEGLINVFRNDNEVRFDYFGSNAEIVKGANFNCGDREKCNKFFEEVVEKLSKVDADVLIKNELTAYQKCVSCIKSLV